MVAACPGSSPEYCPQESLQVTFTLNGPSWGGGKNVYWPGATWSTGMDAGTCESPEGYGEITNLGSADGGFSAFPTCGLGAQCTNGIDGINLMVSAGGIYGNDIAAAVTIGQCCLIGSAVALHGE